MTCDEFLARIGPPRHSKRVGEWIWQQLAIVRPDLADLCRGTEIDPYYKSEAVPAFLAWLRLVWDSKDARVTAPVPVDVFYRPGKTAEVLTD